MAIIGAREAGGAEIVETLEAIDFPVGDLRLLTTPEALTGEETELGGRSHREAFLGEGAFAGLSVAVFASGMALARRYAPAARAAGCWVIDATGALAGEAPLVVPGINPGALPGAPANILSPLPAAVILALALSPLHRAAGVQRAVVSTYHGASGSGRRGMEELEEQTRGILSGSEPEPDRFPHRLAFNVIPQSDSFETEGDDAGWTREELRLRREVPAVLEAPELAIAATAARVPVFTGVAMSVTVELGGALPVEKAREALAGAPRVHVLDEPAFHLYPLLGEVAGRDDVYVGRLRRDPSSPNGLCLWIAADDLRCGVAQNVVGILELLRERALL